jgi:hypothetical protein
MNNNGVEIDINKVLSMFSELTSKERKKTFKLSLRKSANILRKQVVTNLKSIVKDVNTKNRWNQKTLQSGVRLSVERDAQSVKVHILGDFRLKFFELGTKDRYNKKKKKVKLKKERYTGSNKAKYFFKDAKTQTEQQVFSSLEQSFTDIIKKINDKHK